jgi:hypothetical protein
VPPERVPRRTLAGLAVGAVGVRLIYLAAFARDYKPRSDALHYQTLATALAHGDGLSDFFPVSYQHSTAFRPPLYPTLLGAFYWMTGVHVGVGQLLNVALGAVVVVLAAVLGAHIAGYRGGIAAGIAIGLYPPILANDVVLLSEPLGLALLLTMILVLVRGRPAWAGAVCGLLVLTRPSAQLLVVAVAGWLVWRAGWRSAARFGAVTVAVVAPWIVRNWILVGSPTVVTSNGFNLAAIYSAEAQSSGGFADPVFDARFSRIVRDNRSEDDLDSAYRAHAFDSVREDWSIPFRALGLNVTNYFELRPHSNESAERDDGRNITVRNVTLPLFYVVTAAGLVGLFRLRRERGAELLLLEAGYFTLASIAIIPVPRLRLPLDMAAAIGAGVLVAQLIGRRAPDTAAPADDNEARPQRGDRTWSRPTRVLVAVGVTIALIVAAAGIAVVRNRVQDNAQSQLHQTLDERLPAVQRLARFDAAGLVADDPSPSAADFKRAQGAADRLWLLSPRLAGALRSEARSTARALDDAILELKILDLVTAGHRDASSPAAALDAARALYEGQVRVASTRLPHWSTFSVNTAMRGAANDLERLEHRLSSGRDETGPAGGS